MAGSDACPVWLNQVVIGALPVSSSRHNSPAHPHFLNKLVCSHLPCGDACIVVSDINIIKLFIAINYNYNYCLILFCLTSSSDHIFIYHDDLKHF